MFKKLILIYLNRLTDEEILEVVSVCKSALWIRTGGERGHKRTLERRIWRRNAEKHR